MDPGWLMSNTGLEALLLKRKAERRAIPFASVIPGCMAFPVSYTSSLLESFT